MDKNPYGTYRRNRSNRNSSNIRYNERNVNLYPDKNKEENILSTYIKDIHSNINIIKKADNGKYDKNTINKICKETINNITEAHQIVSNINLDNKRDILNFLNRSSQICKNSLWYIQMNDYSNKIIDIDREKKELIDTTNAVENGVKNIYSSVGQQENEDKKEIINELKTLSSNLIKQNDLYQNLDEKINCCMKSLACSMELLSYNVKKSNYIHEDLKKNNIITAKISMLNDNLNQKLIENSYNYQNSDQNNEDEVKQIKELLIEANEKSDKNELPKNSISHYLLHTVLQNSKDILCQIIPQMNLWQRQKIFTTVMKLVEDRIDGCSDKLKEVINKKTGVEKKNFSDEDIFSTIKKVFNTESLRITQNDIKNATWEEDSSDESDSDDESDSNSDSFDISNTMKKNKTEILEDIMNELNKKKNINIKKK